MRKDGLKHRVTDYHKDTEPTHTFIWSMKYTDYELEYLNRVITTSTDSQDTTTPQPHIDKTTVK